MAPYGAPSHEFAHFERSDTSVPLAMPRRGRVTSVGDAIHAMTPTLGRRANLAMRDGALASCEAEMTSYGFDALPRERGRAVPA